MSDALFYSSFYHCDLYYFKYVEGQIILAVIILIKYLNTFSFSQIQTNIQTHAIIILPNTEGVELLVCYEDEGVYVNTYGRITKDVVLQWGEMPTSVGKLNFCGGFIFHLK